MKASEVFKKIRFAKLDPKHDKGPKGSTDDELHGTISEPEYLQQVAHVKKRAMQEEVQQLDEMPGANMDTRAVHAHLKKKGWKLSRTTGGHDVYTHPKAEHHIAVPRHRQLKAPLVKGILKQSEVNEAFEVCPACKADPCICDDSFGFVNESRALDMAKNAGRKNAGLSEALDDPQNVQPGNIDTPAKRSLSKTAGIVKDVAQKAKAKKKSSEDQFQPEPELSTQIVKND